LGAPADRVAKSTNPPQIKGSTMIDKTHIRATMLALTEAELTQAKATYARFLNAARLDRTEPIDADEQAQAETAADLAEAFDDREHEVEDKIRALQALDFGPRTEVAPGAAVRIGDRFLVVSVSTAEFTCQGHPFVGISQAAPIYAALQGKTAGEVCTFRGRTLRIDEVL
jgi:transcription elongation GreA/GreB family factor